MRLIINLILVVLVAVLVYVLAGSIKEPIEFQEQKTKRETAVIKKLKDIRRAQECYRGVTGEFAPSFDTLKTVLETGKFQIIKVIGDPDDPDNAEAVIYDTIYRPAMDSIISLGLNLDSLKYIPFGGGKNFNIQADTILYQSTTVNVVEVSAQRKDFMGAYGDERFAKYDNSYNPSSYLKFGTMNAPNTAGNWEN